MDGQTDPRWLVYKHSILGYQKSIQVIAAQRKCGRTDRQTVWRTDDVITIFFNVGALIIMHKKGANVINSLKQLTNANPSIHLWFYCLSGDHPGTLLGVVT